MEQLKEFFEHSTGFGVLSTADRDGIVNAALFARPTIEGEKALFLTIEKKNLSNLRENKSAYYLFKKDGEGYEGVRLVLNLSRIYQDDQKASEISKKHLKDGIERYILEFDILDILPLVGSA